MIQIIKPSVFPIVTPAQHTALQIFEAAARTCYQSFDRTSEGSAERLLRHCIESGHHSTLEHISFTCRFITSRGVTHELVRHRLCAFSQESTRYVKYSGDVQVIEPFWYKRATDAQRNLWEQSISNSINNYQWLLTAKLSPQAARGVLPTILKPTSSPLQTSASGDTSFPFASILMHIQTCGALWSQSPHTS